MTLFKLGLKNVEHNFKNYVSYFLSSLISVFILMLFFSIYYNPQIQALSSSRAKVTAVFKAASLIVIVFSAIFIWYANSYFIKNKKKEVALYSLLGMKKKEIGVLMFCENIFLGLLSIASGVPLGMLSSSFFLRIYSICIKSDTVINYTFDIRSIIITVAVFAAIFVLSSLKAYRVIYDYELIELMHADKAGETQHKISKPLALVSLLMVAAGYIITLNIDLSSGGMQMIYKVISVSVLVIAGTYILFNNFIVYLFKLFKKNKKLYYKWENLLSISQLIYRIKGNSNMLATITVISAVAITALCFTFSFNTVLNTVIPNGAPFSISYESGDKSLNKQVEAVINKYPKNNITYKKDFEILKATGLTQKYQGPFGKITNSPFDMYIISFSEFNDIMSHSNFNDGNEATGRAADIKIKNSNQCFFMEVSNLPTGRGRLTGDTLTTFLGNTSYKLDISDSDIKGILGIKLQKATIVVEDTLFKQLVASNKDSVMIWRTYNVNNQTNMSSIDNELTKIILDDRYYTTYYSMYVYLHSLYGSFIFIGIFLGILFVASTGSIMYYKQLTEAQEDKSRFNILSKIGLGKKEMLKIVIKQIGFIFIVPLLFGILDSTVALKVYVDYFTKSGASIGPIIQLIAVMMGIYAAVYLCYFLFSVKSYMKIITKKA